MQSQLARLPTLQTNFMPFLWVRIEFIPCSTETGARYNQLVNGNHWVCAAEYLFFLNHCPRFIAHFRHLFRYESKLIQPGQNFRALVVNILRRHIKSI